MDLPQRRKIQKRFTEYTQAVLSRNAQIEALIDKQEEDEIMKCWIVSESGGNLFAGHKKVPLKEVYYVTNLKKMGALKVVISLIIFMKSMIYIVW